MEIGLEFVEVIMWREDVFNLILKMEGGWEFVKDSI